jgi:hypothetical protein
MLQICCPFTQSVHVARTKSLNKMNKVFESIKDAFAHSLKPRFFASKTAAQS